MRSVFEQPERYLVCPHTATAVVAVRALKVHSLFLLGNRRKLIIEILGYTILLAAHSSTDCVPRDGSPSEVRGGRVSGSAGSKHVFRPTS